MHRTDSADSYSGAEPEIGLAMREWLNQPGSGNARGDLFIESKIGPGGACFPLGYDEAVSQAHGIVRNLRPWCMAHTRCTLHTARGIRANRLETVTYLNVPSTSPPCGSSSSGLPSTLC